MKTNKRNLLNIKAESIAETNNYIKSIYNAGEDSLKQTSHRIGINKEILIDKDYKSLIKIENTSSLKIYKDIYGTESDANLAILNTNFNLSKGNRFNRKLNIDNELYRCTTLYSDINGSFINDPIYTKNVSIIKEDLGNRDEWLDLFFDVDILSININADDLLNFNRVIFDSLYRSCIELINLSIDSIIINSINMSYDFKASFYSSLKTVLDIEGINKSFKNIIISSGSDEDLELINNFFYN